MKTNRYNHVTSVVVTALCNQPEALASNLGAELATGQCFLDPTLPDPSCK